MPLTIERQVRELSQDEREQITRYADLLKEALHTAEPPRLTFSNFVTFLAAGCILFFILWLLTIAASWDAPRGMIWVISAFWLIMLAIYTPVLWLLEYRDGMKLFRRVQQHNQEELDRVSEVLDLGTLTVVHVSGSELPDEFSELFPPLHMKGSSFSPVAGDNLVVIESKRYPATWIVDSKGRMSVQILDALPL